jgi:hypothetical protein
VAAANFRSGTATVQYITADAAGNVGSVTIIHSVRAVIRRVFFCGGLLMKAGKSAGDCFPVGCGWVPLSAGKM